MSSALLAKLKPAGPWRAGAPTGTADRVDEIIHSDGWYSALTQAMSQLGWLEEWLDATARSAQPAVRVSSLLFGLDDSLYVPAPASLWPPANLSSRLRAESARWVPASLVAQLAGGASLNEDQWEVDGATGFLLRRGRRSSRSGPYRVALRSQAAVDRLEPGRIAVHQTACLEWTEYAWAWFAAEFATDEAEALWSSRLEGAVKLLGDSGIGGKRSSGWGHFTLDSVAKGSLTDLVLGPPRRNASEESAAPSETGYWLLSLFCPGEGDSIDWARGSYELIERKGRAQSGGLKKSLRMVQEGSVLIAAQQPNGSAPDVAPDGFDHPVFRYGFALSIPIPWRVNA